MFDCVLPAEFSVITDLTELILGPRLNTLRFLYEQGVSMFIVVMQL